MTTKNKYRSGKWKICANLKCNKEKPLESFIYNCHEHSICGNCNLEQSSPDGRPTSDRTRAINNVLEKYNVGRRKIE